MAAKHFYRQGILLLLFNFISTAALERRFSDLKRCADEECSMLLCRGKAVQDFSGPDCRFLSFKESEMVYVYYKLSGRRTDMWAGSIGNSFGYFPKDLIEVNHVYTEKEHEVSAEETDFVCFDTGFDRFDNYDVDYLLGSSKGDEIEETEVPEEVEADTKPSEDEVEDDGKLLFEPYSAEEQDVVADDPSASMSDEPPSTEDVEEEVLPVEPEREENDGSQDIANSEAKEAKIKHEIEEPPQEEKNDPVTISDGLQIPKLQTTFGSTFDAVATDADTTKRTSPNEEEDEIEEQPKYLSEDTEAGSEPLLLSFSEEPTATSDGEDPPREEHDLKTSEEKGMWTKLGDSVFSVVMGGERPETGGSDLDDESDDDDDDLDETQTPLSFDELKKDKEPITGFPQGPDPVEDNQDSNAVEMEELDSDPKTPPFGEVYEEPQVYNEPLDQESQPAEDNTTLEVETDVADSLEQEDLKNADVEATDAPSQEALLDSEIEATEDKTVKEPEEEEQLHSPEIADDSLIKVDRVEEDMEPENNLFESTEQTKAEDVVSEHETVEELLEDENAIFESQEPTHDEQPDITNTKDRSPVSVDPPRQPEYSESIRRLTLLWTYFSEESMTRFRRFLSLKNLYKIESLYTDLDLELQAARQTQSDTVQDIENTLERILEASENMILDEVEIMLDERIKMKDDQVEQDLVDEETEVLDEFQELGFKLRQKYSTARDSTPLAQEKEEEVIQDEHDLDVDGSNVTVVEDKPSVPQMDFVDVLIAVDHKEMINDSLEENLVTEADSGASVEESHHDIAAEDSFDNHTDAGEKPAETPEEPVIEEVYPTADVSMKEESAHFNVNKKDEQRFETKEPQKVPQDTLENPLDMGLSVEVESSPTEHLDLIDPVSDIHEEEVGIWSTGFVYTGCLFNMMMAKVMETAIEMISLLPEDWKPAETFFGLPWQAVVVTASVGVMTFVVFFWRTVLSVKRKEYLVDEKKIAEQIQALKKEKNDALQKITELQKCTEELKEDQKLSAENINCTVKKIEALEGQILESETQNNRMHLEKMEYTKLLEEERESTQQNETRIQKLEKSNEKLQLSRKKIQEALAKTNVLLDEAKIREDARSAQQKDLQKDYTILKEENKTLKSTIKDWEDKHTQLSEQIRVYQKSQKELEDTLAQKDHSLEVLSDLLATIEACDLQKGDNMLANGDAAPEKKAVLQSRIKQMMDVSRVQTTLAVIEEERDRFMTKLLNEEKARKALEEQHQELEQEIGTLKSKKSHIENQFKILQQKNEIMVEMYQQKESALQQRLTKEELERQSKESLLTEVGGKAVEAEEQVKVFRQRISEMEEQLKKTEEVYKEQIKDLENKTHSNWLKARSAEQALNKEKIELSKLREKLAIASSQLNERRAPLFRPSSGQAAGQRQGDSYGPSPVSGGAPSPPIMIEGPRRPPSAPLGRRVDPYGPRPPSDPHGRYPDAKLMSGMDMSGPRSSSPTHMDTPAVEPQINAESQADAAADGPEPGPGSFLASPIRDSPGPLLHGPPPGPGVPPPGAYRPPRPGQYHPGLHGPPLPPNGHPGMPLPAPMGSEVGPRPANGHTYAPRPGPGPYMDLRGPPPPHFRPAPPHFYGPPVHGVRGPMGPRGPFPPDMRFSGPPMDLPPGPPPHPAHMYGHVPPGAAPPSAGPGQDRPLRQDSSQDSARPAPV